MRDRGVKRRKEMQKGRERKKEGREGRKKERRKLSQFSKKKERENTKYHYHFVNECVCNPVQLH